VQAEAKYHLGQVVCHKKHPFRGVIFDVDPEFSNTDEWYSAIPEEARPVKDQPFYHLSGDPVDHPDVEDIFGPFENGAYPLQFQMN
jgi:heat shock protein HspQ